MSLDASSVFSEAPEFGSGGIIAHSIALADVNGDGKPDMLVANECASSSNCNDGVVGVLLGNGDGTFQAAVSYDSGGRDALSIAVADVNGDGKPDLLVANLCVSNSNCSNGTVGVLLGNGDGTFQAAVIYGSGGANASSIAVADVNGDGKPDLLVANQCVSSGSCGNGAVGVLLGNGDGTFQAAVSYGSGGATASSIEVADVNGDGKPDLLVANQCVSSGNCGNGAVGVLLGNGDGTFQAAVSYGSGGATANFIEVADVNGDGKPDLLVANLCVSSSNCPDGEVGVLLGNGDGTFQAAVSYGSGGYGAYSIAVADVNGDGKLDLLVANQCGSSGLNCGSGGVGVLLGNGDGTFQTGISYGSGGENAISIAVADVNGDGKPDLLVANQCVSGNCSSGAVEVLLGNGDGTFQAAVSYGSGGYSAYSIAVADVNGDGKPDLLVANLCVSNSNCPDGEAGVLLGNGDGTFQTAVSYGSGGANAYSIAVADVNGDGKPDLLVANTCVSSGNCSNGAVGVLLGNGDGTFQTGISYGSGGEGAISIAVADVNGDGKPDLLVANTCVSSGNCSNGSLAVLLGNGDGTFQTAVSYGSGGEYAESIVVADVNGDGKPDLLVANLCVSNSNCSNGTVGVLLGNGDGTFQTAVTYGSGGYEANAIAVADVNGDGKPDLLVANGCVSSSNCSNGSLAVLLGNGDGTFQTGQLTNTPASAGGSGIAVGDFNGDGNLDIASGYGSFLLLGNGDGTFQPYLNLGAGGRGIAVGDFNGDGSPDLAVGGVVVLLNKIPSLSATRTRLTSSSSPSVYGQTVTITAAVTTTGSITPTGTVTFTDGSTTLGTVNLVNGVAALSTSFSTIGVHSIAASYSGDAHNMLSSGSLSITVIQDASSTSIASQPNPSSYGQFMVFSATVTAAAPGSGTPTGLVTFYEGAQVLTSITLSNGTGMVQMQPLAVGTHSITATYSGDSNFQVSTSGTLSQVVNPAPTATTVTSNVEPAQVNQQVTYTATISNAFGNAVTGTVTFMDGTKSIGTSTVSGSQATIITFYPKTGTHAISAIYSGDTNNQGSLSPLFHEYVETLPVMTTTKVTSSGSPSLINSPVTFTATVTSIYGRIPDGETVTFYDGATQIGTGTTTSGVVTFTTPTLAAKTHTIKATYAGDATFKTSFGLVTQIVNPYTTSVALNSSLNPSNYGQSVMFTATVSSSGGGTPTGTVTFKNGTTSLGTVTLNSGGVAAFSTAKLAVGVGNITAIYSGDSSNGKSTSSVLMQTVNQAQIVISLTSSPNPSKSGQSVKFTATLTTNGGVPLGQSVTFSYQGTTLGTGKINSVGVAILSTTALPAGSDIVTATFAGNTNFSSASASTTQTVN